MSTCNRHSWIFLRNSQKAKFTKGGIVFELKGIYQCSQCHERRQGQPRFSKAAKDGNS